MTRFEKLVKDMLDKLDSYRMAQINESARVSMGGAVSGCDDEYFEWSEAEDKVRKYLKEELTY